MIARRYGELVRKKNGVPDHSQGNVILKVVMLTLIGVFTEYPHLVENVFARLKHYRAVATRYDKLIRNYTSTLALACLYVMAAYNVMCCFF